MFYVKTLYLYIQIYYSNKFGIINNKSYICKTIKSYD